MSKSDAYNKELKFLQLLAVVSIKFVYLQHLFGANRNNRMKTFAITYDLKQPGRNYSALYDAIRTLAGEDNWRHPLDSVWIVRTDDETTAQNIYEMIHKQMDTNDSLLIFEITRQDRQGWLPKSFWEWIKGK